MAERDSGAIQAGLCGTLGSVCGLVSCSCPVANLQRACQDHSWFALGVGQLRSWILPMCGPIACVVGGVWRTMGTGGQPDRSCVGAFRTTLGGNTLLWVTRADNWANFGRCMSSRPRTQGSESLAFQVRDGGKVDVPPGAAGWLGGRVVTGREREVAQFREERRALVQARCPVAMSRREP